MNNKKTVFALLICGLLIAVSVVYLLISNGVIKNVSVPDVSSAVSELTSQEEEEIPVAYDGNEFVVYVCDWATEESLTGFLADYDAQVTDNSKAEYGCYVITLKETIKAENVPYLIKEMENYLMIENVAQK